MTAEVDDSSYPTYRGAAKRVSVRASIRRDSPPTRAESGASQESPEQQEAADCAALVDWLRSATELLTVWYEHLNAHADRPIAHAEAERFIERLLEVRSDMAKHLYTEGSLLSRLGYAERVIAWEAELAEPSELLMDALYPYRNALRRLDPTSLSGDPAKTIEFEEVAYKRSKGIRRLFEQYRKELDIQITAIRNLLQHGN